jgi:hypothetical protein
VASSGKSQILLLDSCGPADAFKTALRGASRTLDLHVFDTTCFSSVSGHIRRILRWVRKRGIPVVMVRSHTKLDSLGVEYGRLGDCFCSAARTDRAIEIQGIAIRNEEGYPALRGRRVASAFSAFVGSAAYRILTKKRVQPSCGMYAAPLAISHPR